MENSTASPSKFTADVAIEVTQLRKTYGRGEKQVTAVNGVSLSVGRGEIVGLLGPNGAGKTSLIKCILNLVTPDSGRVHVLGMDTRSHKNDMYRYVTGVLEGARNTYWRMSVRENLAFFAGLQGIPARRRRPFHEQLIERFELTDKADTPVNELSQGMKQKVAVACALARETEVLFLDEPTLGLDLHASNNLRASLKQLAADEGRTIILSSHDMDVVQDLCRRVIIMSEGNIVADDSVGNLVALFRTEAYRVTVAAEIDETLRTELNVKYAIGNWKAGPAETTFETNVSDPHELYALMDDLRHAGVPLGGIVPIEPDLADVFMHVTLGTDTASVAPSPYAKEVAP